MCYMAYFLYKFTGTIPYEQYAVSSNGNYYNVHINLIFVMQDGA
jgi:hypothetical protein